MFDTGCWETVYNFRVADWHTYFVGCDEWGFSVWAHNAECSIAVENGQHVLWDRATRKVLHQGTEAEVRAFAKEAGHTLLEGADVRVQKVFRTMSDKEFKKVEANAGLSIRESGASELGITINPDYLTDIGTRKGIAARKYGSNVEFEVNPGTFETLREMGAVHPSAQARYPHLPVFEQGMTVPQVKLERGGVESILLGNSPEGVKIFNANIVNIRKI